MSRTGFAVVLLGAAALVYDLVAAGLRLLWPTDPDHTGGVFVLLAELLRGGVAYPAAPSTDLVYCVFYHPLAFAPYTLLPGSGLDLAAQVRALVAVEVVLCLLLVVALLRRHGGTSWPAAITTVVLTWMTTPVRISSMVGRDDPRATLLALLALWFGLRRQRVAAASAAPFLVLAFFTKLTAPFAPGLALLWNGVRHGGALRLLLACAALTVAGYAFCHLLLGWNLLGNGVYYAVWAAKPARPPGVLVGHLLEHVTTDPLTAGLVGLAAGTLAVRLWNRHVGPFDVLLVGAWVKAVLAYRSHGSETNHLFDLMLAHGLFLGATVGRQLGGAACLVVLLLGTACGRPWEIWPARASGSELAKAAAVIRGQPRLPTLCEEPLLGWLAGQRPIVTDPFLFTAALRGHPGIRAAWFGPPDAPATLQRLVLMADPTRTDPVVESWYTHLHFDAEFLAAVRQHFAVLGAADLRVVLVRR